MSTTHPIYLVSYLSTPPISVLNAAVVHVHATDILKRPERVFLRASRVCIYILSFVPTVPLFLY